MGKGDDWSLGSKGKSGRSQKRKRGAVVGVDHRGSEFGSAECTTAMLPSNGIAVAASRRRVRVGMSYFCVKKK